MHLYIVCLMQWKYISSQLSVTQHHTLTAKYELLMSTV